MFSFVPRQARVDFELRVLSHLYAEAAGRALLTGLIIAHQSFGDQLRWNPHFLASVLEGGFHAEGTIVSIPFSGLLTMTEVYRRRVIILLVDRQLFSDDFAENLLSCR